MAPAVSSAAPEASSSLPVAARTVPSLTSRRLTGKQESFARRYAWHGNASRAYKESFNAREMAPLTVRRKAYAELHRPHVAERIRQYMAEAAEGTTVSARARLVRLQEIAEADPSEIVRVVAEPCPACWSAEALEALAQRRAIAGTESAEACTAPSTPREDCPACHGEGVTHVRITPSDAWSPAARRLVRSIREKDGEIEVRLHDQLAAIDLLNKMQGVYVDRSVNVNLNANVPLPQTREEQLAFLESLRPAP